MGLAVICPDEISAGPITVDIAVDIFGLVYAQ